MSTLPLTEGNLKKAMTDPRYTNARHPQYKPWRDMVSKGFATLYPDDALRGDHTDQLERHQGTDGNIYASDGTKVADGSIRVRSYTRTVNGQVVEVAAHERSGGSGGKASPPTKGGKASSAAPQDHREVFTDAHLAEAQKVADRLNVPVENILGLSALESKWGGSRFAEGGNNFFGQHYSEKVPNATGYMLTLDGKTKVATFGSYADSATSFEKRFGPMVRGVQDPQEFARRLQDSGAFGVNRDGSKVPTYVPEVAATIRGFRARVERRRGM